MPRKFLPRTATERSFAIANPALVIASEARQSMAPARAHFHFVWVMALLWLTLTLLPGLARADEAPVCDPGATSLQRMMDALPVCQKDAVFLAKLGQLLNRQGLYLEAADHLERALMLEPNLKDAQLSYAIALAGSGDILGATALLDDLLADPAMPGDLRLLIVRQKAALAGAGEPVGWQSRFTLATRLGYDSNLLGSPNLESLTLTLSGQNLVLPLDASYLARGGGYARADVQADLHRSASDGSRWDAVASLRSRYSPVAPEAGSSQIDLLLERSQNNTQALNASPSAVGSYFNLSSSGLQSKTGTRYTALGVAGGGSWQVAGAVGCQARLGAEAQERNYLGNQVLSGRYTGVAGFWSCEQRSGAQWLVGLKTGRDGAQDAARPGGDQRQTSLRLTGFLPLNALPSTLAADLAPALANLRRGGLLFDFEHSQQTDSSGYSPIIDNGSTRSVSRRAARLEFQHPVTTSVLWLLGAEWVAQSSSLALFGQDSWGAYSGLRVSW